MTEGVFDIGRWNHMAAAQDPLEGWSDDPCGRSRGEHRPEPFGWRSPQAVYWVRMDPE